MTKSSFKSPLPYPAKGGEQGDRHKGRQWGGGGGGIGGVRQQPVPGSQAQPTGHRCREHQRPAAYEAVYFVGPDTGLLWIRKILKVFFSSFFLK